MGCLQFLRFKQSSHDVYEPFIVKHIEPYLSETGKRILYYVALDDLGENISFHRYLAKLYSDYSTTGICEVSGAVVGLTVSSPNENFTKTFIKKVLYILNNLGVSMPGHPAVEVLPGYVNFTVRSQAEGISKPLAFENQVEALIKRLITFTNLKKTSFNILALHAGHQKISTTLKLWREVRECLSRSCDALPVTIEEIHVDEGQITDCYGCSFETCLYYGLEKRCYYGGAIVENLYPAVEKADLIIWICPNYNDSVSAKLMALINRMTALYRQVSFHNKYIGAIIVSGNSGGDAVAGQLIGALSVNKGFRMWPRFSLEVLANHPDMLEGQEDLSKRIENYVNDMYESIHKNIKNM